MLTYLVVLRVVTTRRYTIFKFHEVNCVSSHQNWSVRYEFIPMVAKSIKCFATWEFGSAGRTSKIRRFINVKCNTYSISSQNTTCIFLSTRFLALLFSIYLFSFYWGKSTAHEHTKHSTNLDYTCHNYFGLHLTLMTMVYFHSFSKQLCIINSVPISSFLIRSEVVMAVKTYSSIFFYRVNVIKIKRILANANKKIVPCGCQNPRCM